MANTKVSPVWGVNENGEVVVSTGTGTNTVQGFINSDEIPVDGSGKLVLANVPVVLTDSSGYPAGFTAPNNKRVIFAPIDVTAHGVKADAIHVKSGQGFSGCSITGNILTDTSASFSAADIGKLCYVAGAGVGGATLSSSIVSVISSTSISLADTAQAAVTGAEYVYGTDDTAAWQALYNNTGDGKICTLLLPQGMSLTAPVPLKNNMSIVGLQADGWAFQSTRRASGLMLKPGSVGPGMLYGTNFSVGNVQIKDLLLDGLEKFQDGTVTKYSGGSTTAGSSTFSDPSANFTSADLGKKIVVYTASSSGGSLYGAAYVGIITSITSATAVVCDLPTDPHPCAVTVSNAAYSYGFSTSQGLDGVITASSNVFNSPSANFTAADIGKTITISGALSGGFTGDSVGTTLFTTITAVNSPTQVVLAQVADLTVSGVKWNSGVVHGVYQHPSPISQDSMWHLEHLVIKNFGGNGIVLNTLQRASRLDKVYVWQCRANGVVLNTSDCQMYNSMAAQCGEDGIVIQQSTNHFAMVDLFNNNGNGVYITPFGQQSSFFSFSIDNNDKNGFLCFAKGVMATALRFTCNSQCKDAQYNDFACNMRYVGGATAITPAGISLVACYWSYGGNGNRAYNCLSNTGPFGIRGTGVAYDANAGTLPYSNAVITSGSSTSLHQTSFMVEGGTTLNFGGNNTFSTGTTAGNGLKIGGVTSHQIGFWGATPTSRPTVTGSRAGNAALASLLDALASVGLVTNSSTA